nr:hypothetical protein [uncultured Holophaga sp.]
MDTTRLDPIPVILDAEEIRGYLRVREGSPRIPRLREMVAQAQGLAAPRALFGMVPVGALGEGSVELEGQTFVSRVLRSNLEGLGRVFPFAITCGAELESWSRGFDGPLEGFWADTIKENALLKATEGLITHVQELFATGPLGLMNPGSLPDWPLSEQLPLAGLLGGLDSIGIAFSPNLVMFPTKSLTGIMFATETSYQNCMLCTNLDCPRRRADFDPELYREKLG